MGDYVYKVTSNTVELSNGETASVAVYAYKPTYYTGRGYASNDQMHVRSGAEKCDRYASTRSEWVVLGYKNKTTGKIEVAIEAKAKKIGKRGSLSDGWFDAVKAETSAVAATTDRMVQLTRTEEVMINQTLGETITYVFDRRKGWVERSRQPFRTFSPAVA
jgi:hypothetical protein